MGKIKEPETGVEHCLGGEEFSVLMRDSGAEVRDSWSSWGELD